MTPLATLTLVRRQAVRATEGALATLRQQNEALQRDVDRFQQRERLLKEARARVEFRDISPLLTLICAFLLPRAEAVCVTQHRVMTVSGKWFQDIATLPGATLGPCTVWALCAEGPQCRESAHAEGQGGPAAFAGAIRLDAMQQVQLSDTNGAKNSAGGPAQVQAAVAGGGEAQGRGQEGGRDGREERGGPRPTGEGGGAPKGPTPVRATLV